MRDWPIVALVAGLVFLAVPTVLVLHYAPLLWQFGLPLTYMPIGRTAFALAIAGSMLVAAAVAGFLRRKSND